MMRFQGLQLKILHFTLGSVSDILHLEATLKQNNYLASFSAVGRRKHNHVYRASNQLRNTGCLKKKYPLLTGNRNEIIRYHYSPSGQLNLSIFNLDPHTLHLKIGHQTLEIQACKVKIYSAPETRGSVKGPSHNLLSQACCTGISTLTFSFFH